MLQALDKHRGKGQQTVRVEHVTVNAGGQAIVGNVSHSPAPLPPPAPTAMIANADDESVSFELAAEAVSIGGEWGAAKKMRDNPMQSSRKRCGARKRDGEPCPSWSMPNGRCRTHGGSSPGAPKGNRNAYKHGHYTAESQAWLMRVRYMAKLAKRLSDDVDAGA